MLDFATLALGRKPNQYLVCPPDRCAATPHRAAPEYSTDVPHLARALWRVLEDQPRLETLEADPAGAAWELVQRSLVFRFPDYVSVRLWPLHSGRTTLGIYSRSRVGHSDFGVNRRRVEGWLAALGGDLSGAGGG